MAKQEHPRDSQVHRHRLESHTSEENFSGHVSASGGEEYSSGLDEVMKALSCQEQVCELYQNLHQVDRPELVTQFERLLLDIIQDVRQYQQENERLEATYCREKEEHLKHLRRLEEEIEHQVQTVEEKVRQQEKDRLEHEKMELRRQLGEEINLLQQNLAQLQQDGESRPYKEEHLKTLKTRLEEMLMENRMLKSELTDAQTKLALAKSEMSSVKHELEEKSYELDLENKTISDYANEQDKLRRQLQVLHDTNKSLLDTNDNLRQRLDSGARSPYKRSPSVDSACSLRSARTLSPGFNLRSPVSDVIDLTSRNVAHYNHFLYGRVVSPCFTRYDGDDDGREDLDSGHSTLRDWHETNDDTEAETQQVPCDNRRIKRHKRIHSTSRQPDEIPQDETDTDGPDSPFEAPHRLSADPKQPSRPSSLGSNRSLTSVGREDTALTPTSKVSRSSTRRQLPAIPTKDPMRMMRQPDRMFKLVLAGDAAVGKSSFILRLCKGRFMTNLSSTLGVDFQTSMLEVDGQLTAIQLWDTAGQERFRSVARTYFRRADGVLLLYDVTYERSFLNVRQWVHAIEDGSGKKLPIMLVGNKTDARPEQDGQKQNKRLVGTEEGLQLSKEIQALFIETSAKDGSNIMEAVIELIRLLRTNEDVEVKTVGLQIAASADPKSSSCCKR